MDERCTFRNPDIGSEISCVEFLTGQLLDGQPLELVKQEQVGWLQDDLTVADVGPPVAGLQK